MAFHLEHTQWWDLLCFIPLSKIGAFLTLSHERPPPGVLGYHGASTNSLQDRILPPCLTYPYTLLAKRPPSLPIPSSQPLITLHRGEEEEDWAGWERFKATAGKNKEKKNAKDCWKKKGMHNYYKSLIKKLENNPSHDKAETFHIDLCL